MRNPPLGSHQFVRLQPRIVWFLQAAIGLVFSVVHQQFRFAYVGPSNLGRRVSYTFCSPTLKLTKGTSLCGLRYRSHPLPLELFDECIA